MVIRLIVADNLYCPVVVCDYCDCAIVGPGNYQWRLGSDGMPLDGKIFFTHKECFHSFERSTPSWMWATEELDAFPVFLSRNMGADSDTARWHAGIGDIPRRMLLTADKQQELKGRAIPPSQRFRILKRDSYRCQICGRAASDGVVLEVDHRQAFSKGGPSNDENLWTTCWQCNRGKGKQDL